MSKISIFILLALLLLSSTNASLIAHWAFDDQALSITDSVGGFTGTTGNAQYVNGVRGKAFNFTGSNQASFGDVLMLTGTDFSFSFWIQTTQTSTGVLIVKHTSGIYGNGYHLTINYPAQYPNKIVSYNAGPYNVVSTNNINDGTWHHIVLTHKVGGMENLYVDGILRDSETALAHASTAAALVLGSSYVGLMDDFRVYNNVLTTGDIATLGTPAPEPASFLLCALALLGVWRIRKASR